MSDVGLVLDTGALLAYARGNNRVGDVLMALADRGDTVLIPATCLAHAYQRVDGPGWDYLDLIANLHHTVVAPLVQDQCAIAGGWARTLGLDTAHAAIEAATHAVVPLMTDRRDLVTQFLREEWPILDVS
jgi:hypothetical protein